MTGFILVVLVTMKYFPSNSLVAIATTFSCCYGNHISCCYDNHVFLLLWYLLPLATSDLFTWIPIFHSFSQMVTCLFPLVTGYLHSFILLPVFWDRSVFPLSVCLFAIYISIYLSIYICDIQGTFGNIFTCVRFPMRMRQVTDTWCREARTAAYIITT